MTFFQKHPMGLVLATSLLTLGALGAVVVFYPIWVDARLIEDLASNDSYVRQQAIADAARRAKLREAMTQKLLDAMDTESDTQFFAIVTALRIAGVKVHNQLHLDRTTAIEFSTAPDPNTQLWLLSEITTQRRDNRYIRQALKAAAASKHAGVRKGAALLAAMLKDDAVLGELLDDEDKTVRAAATLDAGLAGLTQLTEALKSKLSDSEPSVVGGAAAGLAYMNPKEHAAELCGLLENTKDKGLRQQLLHVMTILGEPKARQTVGKILAKDEPSPMAILAGGKLKADGVEDKIRGVLNTAIDDRKTNRNLVHAAIEAADMLDVPVSDQLYKICRQYWNPDWRAEMMFASAASLLGRQSPKASNRDEIEKLLTGAAYYAHRQPTTGPAEPVKTTPIASAAAATAVWLLNPSADPKLQLERKESEPGLIEFTGRRLTGAKIVMDAAEGSILAGDYIAWHIGRSGRDEAFQLGLRMLPPIGAPLGRRVYNENLRGAGAMLLAFSAKSDEQKKIAVQRISERLNPGQTHSGEDDPVLAGRYRCALLILAQTDQLEVVRDQRNDGGHAVPTALTALILTGDSDTMDYFLYNTLIPPQDIAAYMFLDGLDRVLAFAAPELPKIDSSAPTALQLWQADILRDYYMIRRSVEPTESQQ